MSVSAFKEIFKQLNTGYAKNFDPIRFAFIQSLSERLSTPQHQENQRLIKKAFESAQQYQLDLNKHRQQAKSTLKLISIEFPQCLEIAKVMYEQCEFNQLQVLKEKLNRHHSNHKNLAELRELIKDINESVEFEKNTVEQLSIDDIFFQQEQSALAIAGHIPHDNVDGSGEQLVMQSMKQLRESMKHLKIDKIIARAINEGPENPGPLNPQMLAIKSLINMRDLSPSYLRRFASYIETLLWLEKNINK